MAPPPPPTPPGGASSRVISLQLIVALLVGVLVAGTAYSRLLAHTNVAHRTRGAPARAAAARLLARAATAAAADAAPAPPGSGTPFAPQCQLRADAAAGHGPPSLVDISVSSEFSQRARRDAVRAGYAVHARALGMRVRFFVGAPVDAHDEMSAASESRQFDDLVVLPLVDTYANLTLKTLAMVTYTAACGNGAFVIKADDDVFVHAWHLRTRLQQVEMDAALFRTSLGVYMGTMWQDAPPILAWDNKNYEGEYVLRTVPDTAANASVGGTKLMPRGGWYTPYAGGPFYILSRPVAEFLARNAHRLNSRWRNEDMAMGTWMRGLDVEFVAEPRIKVLNWKHSWAPYIAEHNIDDRHRMSAWHADRAHNASVEFAGVT